MKNSNEVKYQFQGVDIAETVNVLSRPSILNKKYFKYIQYNNIVLHHILSVSFREIFIFFFYLL